MHDTDIQQHKRNRIISLESWSSVATTYFW